MPEHVVRATANALSQMQKRALNGSRVLIVGMSYKKNVDDTRESPSFTLIELLEAKGAKVDFYDPHVELVGQTRDHPNVESRTSIPWDLEKISEYEVVLISTDHDQVDYCALANSAKLIVDTRNACARAGADLTRVFSA
jgi:UDP-N-acetyl-D-glucosamine dehydrogenase